MTMTQARDRAAHSLHAALVQGGGIAVEARDAAGQVLEVVEDALGHMPERVGAARAGAQETTITLQTLDDPTLQLIAAASVGCAAGLCLAGSPRVFTLAAVAPALIASVAILTRPGRRRHSH